MNPIHNYVEETLVSWLLDHEYDIQLDMNDFGELRSVFKHFIGYDAGESSKNVGHSPQTPITQGCC